MYTNLELIQIACMFVYGVSIWCLAISVRREPPRECNGCWLRLFITVILDEAAVTTNRDVARSGSMECEDSVGAVLLSNSDRAIGKLR